MTPEEKDAIRPRFEDVRREWHPATARVCCEDVPILLAALEAAEARHVQPQRALRLSIREHAPADIAALLADNARLAEQFSQDAPLAMALRAMLPTLPGCYLCRLAGRRAVATMRDVNNDFEFCDDHPTRARAAIDLEYASVVRVALQQASQCSQGPA